MLLVVPGAAIHSARLYSEEAWSSIGRVRERWITLFLVIPLGVGFVASIVYFLRVRRQLRPIGAIERLPDGSSARFRQGGTSGPVGHVKRARGVFGAVFWVLGFTWFIYDDSGKRVGVPLEALEAAP